MDPAAPEPIVDLTLEIAIDDSTAAASAKRSLESAFPASAAAAAAATGDAPAAAAAAEAPPPVPPATTTNTRPSKRIALRMQRQGKVPTKAEIEDDAQPQLSAPPASQDDDEEQEDEEDGSDGEAAPQPPPQAPRPRPQLPVSGPALATRLAALQRAAASSAAWPPGTPVWVRIQGFSQPWPGCVYAPDLCRRGEVPAIYFAASAAAPRLWGPRAQGFDADAAAGGEDGDGDGDDDDRAARRQPHPPPPPPPLLVRWYGEHTSSWVPEGDIVGPLVPGTADYARRSASLRAHGRRTGRGKLAQAALRETDEACGCAGAPGDEAARVRRLGYARALAVAAKTKKDKAKGRKGWRGPSASGHGGVKKGAVGGGGSSNPSPTAQPPPPPPRSKKLLYKRWRAEQEQRRAREALTPHAGSSSSARAAPSSAELAAGVGSAWALCPCCSDDGTDLACGHCGRAQHALCARPPILGRAYVADSDRWACASCGAESRGLGALAKGGPGAQAKAAAAAAAALAAAADAGAGAGGASAAATATAAAAAPPTTATDLAGEGGDPPPPATPTAPAPGPAAPPAERMGLTPPWLIATVAYKVFGLEPPTRGRPYIAGLLDPCSNSLAMPNVPAEVLYDRHADGLAERNSWNVMPYVWCNPDFSSTVQWRFVNRCSNEIENGQFGSNGSSGVGGSGGGSGSGNNHHHNNPSAPPRRLRAIALLTRNSTDSSFFQRLRCFPRVYIRRNAMRFVDYEKTPIGFGCCLFLLAPIAAPWAPALIQRFYQHLSPYGEPGIPVDLELVRSAGFMRLLARLQVETERDHRDHYAQCEDCRRWRIVDHGAAAAIRRAGGGARWTCSDLVRPSGARVTCRTPLTRAEANMLATKKGGGGEEGGGGNSNGNDNDDNEPVVVVRSMGGYDWRRKAVVRRVVEAIVASVLRAHGEEPPPPGQQQQQQQPAAAAAPKPPPQRPYRPPVRSVDSPYPSESGGGDDSDADVPLEELRQRAERMAAERERAERERERRELLSHLRPGMPAARLLAPLAASSAAARTERDALTAEVELEAAEAADPRSTAERAAASATARRERAARLADLYLASSLAARELLLAGEEGEEGDARRVGLDSDGDGEVDAVARALLPGCPLGECAAVLGRSAPPPSSSPHEGAWAPSALVRRRGQVLARLAAAYLCRARPLIFPVHDQALRAMRKALQRQAVLQREEQDDGDDDEDDEDESAASAVPVAAALSALQLLAPWLLLAHPPAPTPEESRAARERDVLRAPALLLRSLSGRAQAQAAAPPTAAGDVAPLLSPIFAAAARALEPGVAAAFGRAEDAEEDDGDPAATTTTITATTITNANCPPSPSERLCLLAARAVRSSPDTASRGLLASRPDLLLEVAGLWSDEAEHRAQAEAARKERERREARRALAARVVAGGGGGGAAAGDGGGGLARLALPPLTAADLARLPSSAAQVACVRTLEASTAVPEAARAALEQSERARERARQQRALAARLRGEAEGDDSSSSSSDEDDDDADKAVERACLRVLDPLELASLARSAANDALLHGLGLQASALTAEVIPAVEARDPLVALASRRLASRAAAARWERRAQSARRELEARGLARLRVLQRCRGELAAAVAAEEKAREALGRAEAWLARVVRR